MSDHYQCGTRIQALEASLKHVQDERDAAQEAVMEQAAEIERLRALVKSSYYEGACYGWSMSGEYVTEPNSYDIEPGWDSSDSKRALRGEGKP